MTSDEDGLIGAGPGSTWFQARLGDPCSHVTFPRTIRGWCDHSRFAHMPARTAVARVLGLGRSLEHWIHAQMGSSRRVETVEVDASAVPTGEWE